MPKIFGKQDKDPKAKVREAQKELRGSERELEREIQKLRREEQSIITQIKQQAKQGNEQTMRTLAKSVARNRQQQQRLQTAKLQMTSTSYAIKTQTANAAVITAMGTASKAMASANVTDPQKLQQQMMQFQQEAAKMDMADDMLESAFDDIDGEEIDELADEEMMKVMDELNIDLKATNAPTKKVAQTTVVAEPGMDEDLKARLHMLKS